MPTTRSPMYTDKTPPAPFAVRAADQHATGRHSTSRPARSSAGLATACFPTRPDWGRQGDEVTGGRGSRTWGSAVTTFQVVWLMVGCLLSLISSPAAGQNPFGGDPLESTRPADPITPRETSAATRPETTESDPTVRSILARQPKTPEQLMHAIRVLLSMSRTELVKQYAGELANMNPTQETLIKLHRQYGSPFLLRLIRTDAVQPEGGQLGQLVLDAAYSAKRDPSRLAQLVDQLNDAAPERRRAALVDLIQAGDAGLVALINGLVAEREFDKTAAIRAALADIGTAAIDPLLATMESANPRLRTSAIDTLGRIRSRRAIAFLLVPFLKGEDPDQRLAARDALLRSTGALPNQEEASAVLRRMLESNMRRERGVSSEETAVVWQWDDAQQTVVPQQMSLAVASLELGKRIAEQLSRLEPGNQTAETHYLALLLESAQVQAGLDSPLATGPGTVAARVARAGIDRIEEVLSISLDRNYFAAAVAACNLVGEIGNRELLARGSVQPTALVGSLQHPNRRVRFAAAMAIARLDPSEPYPGSSLFPEALAYFVGTGGSPRALVVHPRTESSRSVAAMLGELDIEADTAATPQAAYALARQHPDYEFVLISDAVDRPPVGEFIQRLRRDPTTRNLPVGIMARQVVFGNMKRIVDFDPLAEAYPRPHEMSALSVAVRGLLDLGAHNIVPHEVRVRHAEFALDQLVKLAENSQRYHFYDLMRYEPVVERVMYESHFMPRAAEILGYFGTRNAQLALLTVAGQDAGEPVERKAAAAAFQMAVRRRGILLTRAEILRQYERYNQIARLDQDSQQILGSVLDAMEGRTD